MDALTNGDPQISGKRGELFLVLKPEPEAPGLGRFFPSSPAVGGPRSRHGAQTPWPPSLGRLDGPMQSPGPCVRSRSHHCILRAHSSPARRLVPPHSYGFCALTLSCPAPPTGSALALQGWGSLRLSLPLPALGKHTEGSLSIWTLPCDPTRTPVPLCTPVLWRNWSLGFSDLGGLPGRSGPTRTQTGSKGE